MAKKQPARKTKAGRKPTAEDEAFYRAVLANPGDAAPRLAYADWLAKHGDRARAEFIRVQIRVSEMEPEGPEWLKLMQRSRAWEAAHGKALCKHLPLPPHIRDFLHFERGFPGYITTDFEEFPLWDEALWQVVPLTALRLLDYSAMSGDYDCWLNTDERQSAQVRAAAAAPQLAHILTLDLGECGLRSRYLKRFLASKHLTNLRRLDLSCNGFGDSVVKVVAAASRWPHLTRLNLYGNTIGDAGAQALARSPHLARLQRLVLRDNRIGAAGARALAASKYLANLQRLDLRKNPVEAAQAVLRKRFGERVIL
jgi:uncharacterized protein (TIGR02996 family)